MFVHRMAARYTNRFGQFVEGFVGSGLTKSGAKANAYAKANEKRSDLLHSDSSTLFETSETFSDFNRSEVVQLKADWKLMEGAK